MMKAGSPTPLTSSSPYPLLSSPLPPRSHKNLSLAASPPPHSHHATATQQQQRQPRKEGKAHGNKVSDCGYCGNMATMLSHTTVPAATAAAAATMRRRTKVARIKGLGSFGGLKAHNKLAALGLPVCTDQHFTKVLGSLKCSSPAHGRGGGALSSTCNAAGEIFNIAFIMNGLVLVGVAVGFVLLRIEASLEDAE